MFQETNLLMYLLGQMSNQVEAIVEILHGFRISFKVSDMLPQ